MFYSFILFLLFTFPFFSLQATYYSQVGQDKYVYEHFFKHKKQGICVDIGAHDGTTGSNSRFFEELGWHCICIEPLPHLFKQLERNRKAACINACIAQEAGIVPFLHLDSVDEQLSGMLSTYDKRQLDVVLKDIQTYGGTYHILKVPALRLMDILEQHGITHIDFLSCDTEGSELEIMQSLDFSKVQVDVMTIENNYGENRVRDYLASQGFCFIARLSQDDIFVRSDFV